MMSNTLGMLKSMKLSVKYGSEILFFVFVGNVEPKTEMEDTNTTVSNQRLVIV